MEWILQNWVWILFAMGMIAMHMFGHGGHGRHDGDDQPGTKLAEPDSVASASKRSHRHHH